jgi:ubiquinone/menaquinone biosynthesis C-methylase UbiE
MAELTDYFVAYDDVAVHHAMLSDVPRMRFYEASLSPSLVAGKVVLDVGCGTGILSMMAARAGARRVYACEASGFADVARGIVEANGLSDVVTVIQSMAEDLELPEQVDVVVSEWMGFYLLHENMLPSVIAARDRWMKPGGTMVPDAATLYWAPISMAAWRSKHLGFFANVSGFDMSLLAPMMLESKMRQPLVDGVVTEDQPIAAPAVLRGFDLNTATAEDVTVGLEAQAEFIVTRPGTASFGGFALWFDVSTAVPGGVREVMSTAPGAPTTHWHQTVVPLGVLEDFEVPQGADIAAKVSLTPDPSEPRHFEIAVEM